MSDVARRLKAVEVRRTRSDEDALAARVVERYGTSYEAALGCSRWVLSFERDRGRLPTWAEVAREVANQHGVDEAVALAELDRLVEERGLR